MVIFRFLPNWKMACAKIAAKYRVELADYSPSFFGAFSKSLDLCGLPRFLSGKTRRKRARLTCLSGNIPATLRAAKDSDPPG